MFNVELDWMAFIQSITYNGLLLEFTISVNYYICTRSLAQFVLSTLTIYIWTRLLEHTVQHKNTLRRSSHSRFCHQRKGSFFPHAESSRNIWTIWIDSKYSLKYSIHYKYTPFAYIFLGNHFFPHPKFLSNPLKKSRSPKIFNRIYLRKIM